MVFCLERFWRCVVVVHYITLHCVLWYVCVCSISVCVLAPFCPLPYSFLAVTTCWLSQNALRTPRQRLSLRTTWQRHLHPQKGPHLTVVTPWCTFAGTGTPVCPWWTIALLWRYQPKPQASNSDVPLPFVALLSLFISVHCYLIHFDSFLWEKYFLNKQPGLIKVKPTAVMTLLTITVLLC